MQRLASNVKKLSLTVDAFSANATNLQIVRWGRKPRWLPTPRSKLFRVPPRPQIPLEDNEELKRLHNNYRTAMKSLAKYFKEKYTAKNMQDLDLEKQQQEIEVDFVNCSKINDEWNAEIKVSREERINKEYNKSIEYAKEEKQKRLKIYAERMESSERIIREVKEASKYFITPDQLDTAIEHAFNNPIDYNFALNLDGTTIQGRETGRSALDVNEKVTVQQ